MSNIISFKNTRWVVSISNKSIQLVASIQNFKETHRPFFMNCAIIYMSIKIGLILLATFATMVLLTSYISQHLALEMTKTKALLFASPLTLIVMLKLFFIFKILMAYDRSRVIMRSAINVIFMNGSQGMKRIEETFPVGLSALSLEKAKNQ